MSWRTSLTGVPAGLAFLISALLQPGPWTLPRIAAAIGGTLLAVLGVLARDHATPPPPVVLPLDVAQVRAEIAHVLASLATVRESDPPVSPSVVRAAAERVLVGSDRPGATPVSVAKGGGS